ncbi:MAG: SsrA-binding protein SmpB [Limnochordaceae bacterium]|uniref:SsrA-binding protein n=1 Tax=Carboxydichorda subterranea TaxID=3109565 RepID=A0ABZ1BYZ2_9FIRM|nr:SsrA-binding protein SmpB [Limnochorda sp. L945t]MBE3598691.1 SsrA-binding protein SmpB [Limnochordaceae bacterium]WRP18039.1 SsrA-binding protein SmpB [Limnochorda sp. L945t]
MAQPKTVCENRKARHDYEILETVEAGLVLTGSEVKSLRLGRAQLRDSYARIKEGELFLHGAHISAYQAGNYFDHDPTRPRKLLLHKREIARLAGRVAEKGLTIVPLRIYFNERGIAKVELALARGRKEYDRREAVARREQQRRIDQALAERRRAGS